jgi:hypothetical protein
LGSSFLEKESSSDHFTACWPSARSLYPWSIWLYPSNAEQILTQDSTVPRLAASFLVGQVGLGRCTSSSVNAWALPFFFFFLMRPGFELRTSLLQSRLSTAWATPPVHLPLVILEMGGLLNYLPWLALNCNPPNLSLPSS